MKTYHVVTLFPEMIKSLGSYGVLAQAQKNHLLEIETHDPRLYTEDIHRSVDDRPFGGGDGMLMLIEPLEKTLKAISNPGRIIYLSPQGPLLNEVKVKELSQLSEFTLICGRYGGIDQRFLNEYVDEEISIGDYVLSGGEFGAAVVIDAVSRFVPGVLGHEHSASEDSLTLGYLEAPAFTRPREWRGVEVPEVLLSGNHSHIVEWKLFVGILTTLTKRPELLKIKITAKQAQRLRRFAEELNPAQISLLGLENMNWDRLTTWLESQV